MKTAKNLAMVLPGGRQWRYQPWQGDLALALVVGAIEIVGTHFAGQHNPDRRALDAGGTALLAAGAAALLFRRQYPVAVLVSTEAAFLSYWFLHYARGPVFLALVVAFLNVVLSGRRRLTAWSALAAGFVAFLGLSLIVDAESRPGFLGVLQAAGWLLALATAAEVVGVRRQRSLEAKRAREEANRRRAGEERLRIARDLHDVLAHNISLINVQAGVALHLIDERPEQARTALSAIKDASKDALRELRSVLDILRQADEEPQRDPSPGLSRLSELVSRVETAGLKVRTEIVGDLKGLPADIDLVAFRIAQEALTNIVRHAQQATVATIRVARSEREISVQIDDDGRTMTRQADDGTGIAGMRERAAALGGTVEAGSRRGGGFRVLARLPLDDGS